MDKLRFGIVGTGGMGSGHAGAMSKIEECELTAVCDIDPNVVKELSAKYEVKGFTDYKELIDSGLVDAVTVATPHYFHPVVAIYAMQKGLPVLSEKPMAVSVKAADEMINASKENGVPFTIMYQSRTAGINQTVHKLIESGKLGEIYRTCMIKSGFRTQAYYNSSGWRATWVGEGGGVLINQAPHALDLITWFAGVPSRVTAITKTRRHKIEVEDEASAILEYPNGAVGYINVSTTEAPGTNLVEICGDKAKIVLSGNNLQVHKLETPVQEFTDNVDTMWGGPKAEKLEVPIEERQSGHGAIILNFANHIMHDEPLIVPGEEGIKSMELMNAMIMSGKKGKPVDTPVDRDEYEDFLEELRTSSKKKSAAPAKRVTDPNLGNR